MGESSDPRSSAAVFPLKDSVSRPTSSSSNRISTPPIQDQERPSPSSASSFASSLSSSSAISDASFPIQPSSSPARVNLRHSSPPPARSVSISLDRVLSSRRSVSFREDLLVPRTCMCSPTTHPGSFRCNYHRSLSNQSHSQPVSSSPSGLNLRRSAMTNSLVRIGAVGGDRVTRALTALIPPSSHQQRRRTDFQPRPSRLSIMSRAEDDNNDS